MCPTEKLATLVFPKEKKENATINIRLGWMIVAYVPRPTSFGIFVSIWERPYTS